MGLALVVCSSCQVRVKLGKEHWSKSKAYCLDCYRKERTEKLDKLRRK